MDVRKDSEVGWGREGWGIHNEMGGGFRDDLGFFFPPLSSALAGHLDVGEDTAIP